MDDINDIRLDKEFRGITFSGYKLTEVKQNIITCLNGAKIEEACYWSAELVCAAHYTDLWDVIIYYYSRYIHIANPKMGHYLEQRIRIFVEIIKQYSGRELTMRNNTKVRQLVCEVICMLCTTRKSHPLSDIKIPEYNRDISSIRDKFTAPNVNFLKEVFKEEDPKELYVPINEFCYQICREGKDTQAGCFWIEWIMDHAKQAKKSGAHIVCGRRVFHEVSIPEPSQIDPIWLVWDSILKECVTRKKPIIKKICESLLYLFSVRYSQGTYTKRKYLLFTAVSLLTMPINITQEQLITEQTKRTIEVVKEKIHKIYRQIKRNEQSPNTDYLFNGLDNNKNFETSMKKLELLNELGMGGTRNDTDDNTEEPERKTSRVNDEMIELR